ncbi:MAG: hypothetical protein HKL83_01810, partial [Acidimicrobiaceae bacterium]|nr:hypothetical protein [Acidimicrobiaceae bacterium]
GFLDQIAIGGPKDDIEAALRANSSEGNINLQLEQMKAELGLTQSTSAPSSQASLEQAKAGQAAGEVGAAIPAGNEDNLVVRIAGVTRYRVPSSIKPALEGLDVAMETAINSGDEASFAKCADSLQKLLAKSGVELQDTDLTPSDLVVPSPDMTIAEAKSLLGKD